MPISLVILENHSSTAAKEFIINNAVNLKNLGYKKILFEVPKEHTPTSYKSQLQSCVIEGERKPGSPEAMMMVHAKPMLELLNTLDRNQISYEFIDPQTESGNQNMIMKAMKKLQQGLSIDDMKKQLAANNEANAKIRDKEMSVKVIQDDKEHNGAVIFLGGFMHKELVGFLKNDSSDYRSVIFDDSQKKYPVRDAQAESHKLWSQLADSKFRNQFYGTKVSFFDLATKPTFEIIEAISQLTSLKFCPESTVGNYLNQSTNREFECVIDEHYVVSASAQVDNEKVQSVVNKIEKNFPGLRFFNEKNLTSTLITIPGINLPENHDLLAEGFVKTGVMRR